MRCITVEIQDFKCALLLNKHGRQGALVHREGDDEDAHHTMVERGKVEKVYEDSPDLFPSPSVKIQIIGGKNYWKY